MDNKWATIYTDASGKGGWAGRVRYGQPPYRCFVKGNSDKTDVCALELLAIVETVKAALNQWDDIVGVGVRSDSQAALNIVKFGAKPHRREDLRQLQTELQELLKNRGVKIRTEWVRGHQQGNDAKAYLNRWCDEQSRS